MPYYSLSDNGEILEESWVENLPSDSDENWYLAEEYEARVRDLSLIALKSENGVNDKSHFKDKKHPLAHDESDIEVWDAEHRRILENIHAMMEKKGLKPSDLSRVLPNKNGKKGVSLERTREIVNQRPETASVQQVVAMCVQFDCSMDYLKGLVRYPEQRLNWGSPSDMASLYRALSIENRATVWKVAIALLKEDEEAYLEFMETYD